MTMPPEHPVRLLVVSHTIPTAASGTPVIIRRLLSHFTSEEVVLIGRPPRRGSRQTAVSLPFRATQVPTPQVGIRGDPYWMIASILPVLAVAWRATRRHRPHVILSFYPDEGALLAGHLLTKWTGLPHVVYLCDLYLETPRPSWQQWLARWLQPKAFHGAARLVVVNEAMAQFYRERYGLDAVVVPTCINSPIPEHRPPAPPRGRLIIGFAGNVNEDRIGPLKQLTRLVGDDSDYEIRYFSGQGEQFLRSSGLWASNVRTQLARDDGELHSLLSECDVLYLPLTFLGREDWTDQRATCFGIKAYDYFLSQKPIVVHCPGEFFTSRFFRDRQCGLCVTSEDPNELEGALLRLRADSDLRDSLVRNALNAAHEFRGESVSGRFRSALSDVVRQTSTRIEGS